MRGMVESHILQKTTLFSNNYVTVTCCLQDVTLTDIPRTLLYVQCFYKLRVLRVIQYIR